MKKLKETRLLIVFAAALFAVLPAAIAGEPPADPSTWTSVTSHSGVFSIRIPDGWKIGIFEQRDVIMAGSLEDIEYRPGKRVTIFREKELPKGDGTVIFNVIAGKGTGGYRPPKIASVTQTDFGPVDGVMGKRLTLDYKDVPQGWDVAYWDGERQYVFSFTKNGCSFNAVYTIFPEAPDQLPLIEQVVKTMRFLK